MGRRWRDLRVFLSSTFRDMHGERDHLVRVVFPRLRARLEPYRFHLIDVDLRWGVTREQAESDRVLDLCLQQIELSRPFFVAMLGERYGWVPREIAQFDGPARGWVQALVGKSLTELEILHGVLARPAMRGHGCFYFRDPSFLDSVPTRIRTRVFEETPSEEDVREIGSAGAAAAAAERHRRLASLKQDIRAYCLRSGSPLRTYRCCWAGIRLERRVLADAGLQPGLPADGWVDDNAWRTLDPAAQAFVETHGSAMVNGLEEFGAAVEEDLWRAMAGEHPEIGRPVAVAQPLDADEWLLRERELHADFAESRLRVFIERTRHLEEAETYLAGDESRPLVVLGPAGTGKSALLAAVEARWRNAHPEDLVVSHFVGASGPSTSLPMLLRRLCLEVAPRLAGDGGQEPYRAPGEDHLLAHEIRALLSRVSENGRVVLLIDALDQLDPSDLDHAADWLPASLPRRVRIVLSALDAEGEAGPALASLLRGPLRVLRVGSLSPAEQFGIVEQRPALAGKALDPAQVRLLLENPATRNPLFLCVALEELRGFGSFELLERKIASLPHDVGVAGLMALFTQVLERLEDEEGRALVRATLGLLACGRTGLGESELKSSLRTYAAETSDREVACGLAIGGVDIVMRQLRPYLQYRGAQVDFHHRVLRETVWTRYVAPSEARHAFHRALAHALWALGHESERMLLETPFHLAEAARWDEFESLVTDAAYLVARTRLRGQRSFSRGLSLIAHEPLIEEVDRLCATSGLPTERRSDVLVGFWRSWFAMLSREAEGEVWLRTLLKEYAQSIPREALQALAEIPEFQDVVVRMVASLMSGFGWQAELGSCMPAEFAARAIEAAGEHGAVEFLERVLAVELGPWKWLLQEQPDPRANLTNTLWEEDMRWMHEHVMGSAARALDRARSTRRRARESADPGSSPPHA